MKKSIIALTLALSIFSCKKDDDTPENTPTPPSSGIASEVAGIVGVFDGDAVGAAANLTEDIVVLFSANGESYAWFEEGVIQLVRDMDATNSHFKDRPINIIGAATVLNNGQLYVFDETGDMYTKIDFNLNAVDEGYLDHTIFSFNQVFPLTIWGVDNSCPFVGISAAWSYSDPGTECFDAIQDQLDIWMMSETGDEYTRWSFPGGGTFVETDELENWTAENNCGGADGLMPFESITAAFRLISPNKIQEVFFGPNGQQFCYYSVSEGVFSEVYDLD